MGCKGGRKKWGKMRRRRGRGSGGTRGERDSVRGEGGGLGEGRRARGTKRFNDQEKHKRNF